jgi:hypothetical protein
MTHSTVDYPFTLAHDMFSLDVERTFMLLDNLGGYDGY